MLPMKQKIKYVFQKKILRNTAISPDLYSCVDHIIIHPGGPAVIEGTAKGLGIDILEKQKSSINALYYYGNTSSAGNWYSIAHTESTCGLKKGEKVMFLGLGAAFEANAAIWRALKDINEVHDAWSHVASDRRDEAETVFREYLNGNQTCSIDGSAVGSSWCSKGDTTSVRDTSHCRQCCRTECECFSVQANRSVG